MLPRLMLRGLVATMPVADLLEWMDRRAISGTVHFEREGMSRRLLVEAGSVTRVTSSHPAEHLGRVLVGAGYVTDEQLAGVYRAGQPLGQLLVAGNYVAEDEMRAVLEHKVLEAAYELLSWDDGSFTLEPGALPPRNEVAVAVPIARILAEGPARAALWRAYRERIPSDDVRFRVVDTTGTADELVQDVARGLSVRELMLERRWMPFPTYRRLAELSEHGHIVPLGGAGVAPAVRVAATAKAILGRPGVPRLARPVLELAGYDLTAAERTMLGRVDGRWDAATLVRTSSLPEVEALVTLERLAARGLVLLDAEGA